MSFFKSSSDSSVVYLEIPTRFQLVSGSGTHLEKARTDKENREHLAYPETWTTKSTRDNPLFQSTQHELDRQEKLFTCFDFFVGTSQHL
jgi:hypothetical protein